MAPTDNPSMAMDTPSVQVRARIMPSLWDVLTDSPMVMLDDLPSQAVLGLGWAKHRLIFNF